MHKRSKILSGVAVAAVTAAVAGSPGCSFALNTTAVQCTAEDECRSRGPGFEDTTCDPATRSCVKVPSAAKRCEKNSDCAGSDANTICRKSDNRCVQLLNKDCPLLLGDTQELLDDDVIVLGVIAPASVSAFGALAERAVWLAQKDVAKSVKGLPATAGSDGVRPVVFVSCFEFNDPPFGDVRSARHLVEDLQVPAIVGPIDPAVAVPLAADILLPAGVMTFLPTAIVTSVEDLPNPAAPTPLVWRINYSDVDQGKLIAELIEKHLEPRLKAEGVVAPGEPVRIAIAAEDNALGQSVLRRTQEVLRFNGKSAADNAAASPPTYAAIQLPAYDPTRYPDPIGAVIPAVQKTFDFKPHIVIHASALFSTDYFNPLEANWPDGVPRPVHIAATPPWLDDLTLAWIGTDDTRAHRFFGVGGGEQARSGARSEWTLRFKQEFGEFQTLPVVPPIITQFYDAAFATLMAAAAVGDKPLTGANIANGLMRLQPPGPEAFAGPDSVAKIFGDLAQGKNVNLEGVVSGLDFDITTGRSRRDAVMFCPQKAGGTFSSYLDTGLRFDTERKSVVGAVTGCP